jgi:hypothetical protein
MQVLTHKFIVISLVCHMFRINPWILSFIEKVLLCRTKWWRIDHLTMHGCCTLLVSCYHRHPGIPLSRAVKLQNIQRSMHPFNFPPGLWIESRLFESFCRIQNQFLLQQSQMLLHFVWNLPCFFIHIRYGSVTDCQRVGNFLWCELEVHGLGSHP